jgi:putative effector of murein hydrolase LrgA (UPF0299 family)
MRGAVAAGGTAVAAALCCLAIPLTVGIIGASDLAAFGANLGVVAILASGLIVALTLRSRSRRAADGSRDGDG